MITQPLHNFNHSDQSQITSAYKKLIAFENGDTEAQSYATVAFTAMSGRNMPWTQMYTHSVKVKGKVDYAPQESIGGCSSPSSRPWVRRWRTTNVCDTWPVRRQTYAYLPSCKASPPIGWYQIILLGDRGTCVTTCSGLPFQHGGWDLNPRPIDRK